MPGQVQDVRQYFSQIKTVTPLSGRTERVELPRVGTYARVWITVDATTNAVPGAVNPLGFSSILDRVNLFGNMAEAIFDMSGPGYNYLLRPNLDLVGDPFPDNNGRNAIIGATDVNLDMMIPVSINLRDPVGILVGANAASLFTCLIRRALDADVAPGGITWTKEPEITVYLEFFSIPADPSRRWPVNLMHQILEDQQQISATGAFQYLFPRGGTFVGVYFGFGMGEIDTPSYAEGADQISIRANQSTYLFDHVPPRLFSLLHGVYRYQSRIPGTYFWDTSGSTGLGNYDQGRDWLHTQYVTQLEILLNAVMTGTFTIVRRQLILVALPQAQTQSQQAA